MKIAKSVTELIGKTPLLELSNIEKSLNLQATILGKLEYFNPAGSIKDRVAFNMIQDAMQKGLLKPGSTIIEPTSGNTGIGIASVAASLGFKAILTMPDTMSKERIDLLKAFGAEIFLTPGADGMAGAVKKAEELALQIPGSFIPSQFENPANAETHIKSTAKEIWEDTDGKIDYFIAGIGTGGTITGNARYLKEKNPNIKIIGIEPASSPLITKGTAGKHGLQGIGANFIPKLLDLSVVDDVVTVSDEDAFKFTKMLSTEGILVGITSGAAAFVASELAKKPENKDKVIVAIFPDSGERYLSTGIYN